MPKNRTQGIIFGILMSITMAYGMEVYNVAWKMGMPVAQLPAIWVGMLIKNFPMALLWNFFGAAPLSRLIFRKCFSRVDEKHNKAATGPTISDAK